MTGKIDATSTPPAMRFSDANFQIAGNKANGLINMATGEDGKRRLDGTLAFDELDIFPFVQNVLQNSTAGNAVTNNMAVDLRISANTLKTGSVELQQVAAAVTIDESNWSFDIGDAQIFEGNIIGQFGETKNPDDENARAFIKLTANNVSSTSLLALVPEAEIGLAATGDISVDLRSRKAWSDFEFSHMNGSVSINLDSGAISGIDFLDLLRQDRDLNAESSTVRELGGNTRFQKATAGLFVSNGVASIAQSNIQFNGNDIQLIGSIDLQQGNLAVRAQRIREDGPEPERLFIGGTMKSPFVTIRKSNTPEVTNDTNGEASNEISN